MKNRKTNNDLHHRLKRALNQKSQSLHNGISSSLQSKSQTLRVESPPVIPFQQRKPTLSVSVIPFTQPRSKSSRQTEASDSKTFNRRSHSPCSSKNAAIPLSKELSTKNKQNFDASFQLRQKYFDELLPENEYQSDSTHQCSSTASTAKTRSRSMSASHKSLSFDEDERNRLWMMKFYSGDQNISPRRNFGFSRPFIDRPLLSPK